MRYLKALGLGLLAACSLMAFSAAGASAGELGGDFLINEELLTKSETVGGELEDWTVSSLLIPSINYAIRCHSLEMANGTILPLSSNRSFGHASILYLGCLVFTHKTLEALTKCTIGEGGDITAAVLFHVVREKANGTSYVLIEPANGLSQAYTIIPFGPLCGALAEEEIAVTGSLVGEVLTKSAVKIRAQEAPEGIQLLFGDKLKFGTAQAFFDGVMKIFVTGGSIGSTVGIEAGA